MPDRRHALLPLLFALLACAPKDDTPDTDTATSDATTGAAADGCAYIVGKTFRSVDMLECGPGPNGPVLCNWELKFTDATFTYSYSDLYDSGPYTCADGVVTAQNHGGTVDSEGGAVTWDEVAFVVAP